MYIAGNIILEIHIIYTVMETRSMYGSVLLHVVMVRFFSLVVLCRKYYPVEFSGFHEYTMYVYTT